MHSKLFKWLLVKIMKHILWQLCTTLCLSIRYNSVKYNEVAKCEKALGEPLYFKFIKCPVEGNLSQALQKKLHYSHSCLFWCCSSVKLRTVKRSFTLSVFFLTFTSEKTWDAGSLEPEMTQSLLGPCLSLSPEIDSHVSTIWTSGQSYQIFYLTA